MKVQYALFAAALALASVPAGRAQEDSVVNRRMTETVVEWRTSEPTADGIIVHLVALNDLHGHLVSHIHLKDSVDTRKVGGAAAIANWVNAIRVQAAGHVLLLFAGDSFGASPPESGLLRDEPTLTFLNMMAEGDCPVQKPEWAGRPVLETSCHVIATPGNHEFDRGTAEFQRLMYGGNGPGGKVLGQDWKGTHIPFVAANVVHKDGGAPLLPTAALVNLNGIRIGVVGAVTADTPALVVKERIQDLEFLPEVAPINGAVAHLRAAGAMAVVLLIHEGLSSPVTPQPTPINPEETTGRLAAILAALDPGIDVVVSGHTHKLTNVLVRGKDPKPLLVTQARSDGTAFTDIELVIDPHSRRVAQKGAEVLTVWSDEGPGMAPNDKINKMVQQAVLATKPVTDRLLGTTSAAITREATEAGDSPLGDLVADAMRAAARADVAFVSPGSLRADLPSGPITWGMLYTVLPFGNTLVRISMTGEQIQRLLEEQWYGANAQVPKILKVSGMSYLYNGSRAAGRRVVAVYDARGGHLEPARRYQVAVSDFLADGGDHYGAFNEATDRTPVARDIDAFEAYLRAVNGTIAPPTDPRITRVDNH
jgi:5'-nucleotidase